MSRKTEKKLIKHYLYLSLDIIYLGKIYCEDNYGE